jgi:hypothetical protein
LESGRNLSHDTRLRREEVLRQDVAHRDQRSSFVARSDLIDSRHNSSTQNG